MRPRPSAAATAFAVAFGGMLVYTLLEPRERFVWDSGLYWLLGDAFVEDGRFSLLNYDNALRGYVMPLITFGLERAGVSDSVAVKVFNSLVFAAVATLLLPALARTAFPEHEWGVARRLGAAVLLVVFWGGYLAFPLTDVPALAAAMVAVIAVARAPNAVAMAVAGVAAALALNLRPSYLLLVPIVAGLYGWAWLAQRRKGSAGRWAVGALTLALGLVVVSLPQSLAMHRHHDTYSPVPGAAKNLAGFQLTAGLRLQRYETFTGTTQPSPAMNYVDETGREILAGRRDGKVRNGGEYLDVIAEHPAAMVGVWTRHVVNGLDQRYSTPYIDRLAGRGRNVVRLLGFLLVFMALLRVAWPAARKQLGPARWRYVAALPACCLTSIPAAMETRFLLPVYVVAWLLVLAAPWPNPLRGTGVRRIATPIAICAGLVLFFALVLPIVGAATDSLRFG